MEGPVVIVVFWLAFLGDGLFGWDTSATAMVHSCELLSSMPMWSSWGILLEALQSRGTLGEHLLDPKHLAQVDREVTLSSVWDSTCHCMQCVQWLDAFKIFGQWQDSFRLYFMVGCIHSGKQRPTEQLVGFRRAFQGGCTLGGHLLASQHLATLDKSQSPLFQIRHVQVGWSTIRM